MFTTYNRHNLEERTLINHIDISFGIVICGLYIEIYGTFKSS